MHKEINDYNWNNKFEKPKNIIAVNEFIRTASGKIKRKEIRIGQNR